VTPVVVYLVPVASTQYELYCESAEVDDLDPTDEHQRHGIFSRFRYMMAEALESRRARRLAEVPADPSIRLSWMVRLRNFVIGRVAEAIVEWRLLWHLRKQSEAELVYPNDLNVSNAMSEMYSGLKRDADRHWRRVWVSSLLGAVLGPLLFFVPGPNLVAYYFWFLAVGHLLAWRGAKHGMEHVNWQPRSDETLAELRTIFTLAPDERAASVRDIESRLGLEYFSAFFERTVVRFHS
tara:strand:- start:842 stop:1552 length:711 start_codon:yes stop_codon:yes gene_type:complete